MKNFFELGTRVEGVLFNLESIENLINIVITEVFDTCAPSDKVIFGRLNEYEYSFRAVLEAAQKNAQNQIKDLTLIANELYALSKKEG